MKNLLPKRERKSKKSWMTEDILQLMDTRKKLKGKDNIQYNNVSREIKRKCKEEKENWWSKQCDEIEKLENQHKTKEMHDKIKEVTGGKKRTRGSECIKDKDGNILFEEEEVKRRWEEYVGELFDDNRGDVPTIENEDDGEDILVQEVEQAIKELKTNKAPGMDGITSEMIQALDDTNVEALTMLLNKIYIKG